MIQSCAVIARMPVTGKIVTRLVGAISFGLLVLILAQFAGQIAAPPPARRLLLVRDIPLPSALPVKFLPDILGAPPSLGQLTPGVAVHFDHFDFQALDANKHLLFIAHTGPNPDKIPLFSPTFNPDRDSQVDGHVLVFDTRQNKVIHRINIPQVAGLVVAPDINRIFAADANDNIVYSIDEKTFVPTAIHLGENQNPDAISYDPQDHKIFVSTLGAPNPVNVERQDENLTVIDTRTNYVARINLGFLPLLSNEHADLEQWGYTVGHNSYDPTLHRVFVVIQQQTDQSPAQPALPPPGTGELVAINPVTELVVGRVPLPRTCGSPHGMAIDTQSHIAFIACTDVDPEQHLVQNLLRVDLQTMLAMPDPLQLLALKPDVVRVDSSAHMLFVGCSAGISVFDIHGRIVRKLGDYMLGRGTHTIAINEAMHYLYLPLVDVGGRPVLRIARYNPY